MNINYYQYMKKLFTVLTCVLLSLTAMAQSANVMSMARAELQKRGLVEADVRARLLEDGINIDTLSPADYPAYQDRIMRILDQMEAENAQPASGTVAPPTTPYDVAPKDASQIVQTTMGEAAAEAALDKALEENHVSTTAGNDIFGHSLFTNANLSVFRTTDGAQAPDSYVLGEGDEVHISIFGSSQTEIHQRIAPDGSIQPAGSSKIFLKGLTLAQARQAIRSKLAQHYSFRQDQIAVTISTARTVQVGIYGEVGVQGDFTLSALNTVFNALAAAGGPTANGSIREIQLSRGGKTYTMDLYKYMLNPTQGVGYEIQNGDVIFVPVARKIVDITGAVYRPMRYEVVDGDNVSDLIKYAGGLTANANPDFIQVAHLENGKIEYNDYDMAGALNGAVKIRLENGDRVAVHGLRNPEETFVAINGDVYYEGRYDLSKNPTLKALLENAKPRYTAITDYVLVERTHDDQTVEVLTVPFPGVKGNPDFALQSKDVVSVRGLMTYRDVDSLAVRGEVRKPFSREFSTNDRMTVGQAIEYAGGLKPNVFPVAYIVRKDVTNPDKREYISVSLERDLEKLLQPGDELTVYDNSTYTNIGEVSIFGAVKNAMGVTYDPSLTLHDLIMMAGGFETGAAYNRVEVFRTKISDTQEVEYDQITLAVNEDYYPVDGDFQFRPYDKVVVRMTPNFATSRTVEINGRVRYPGTYVLEDSTTSLSEIIKQAGGLLDDADPYATIFRTNGRIPGNIGFDLAEMNKHKGKLTSDPNLMEGDVINVVRQENTVTIRTVGTRMSQYVPEGFEESQKTVIYQGPHSAGWYIRHYAGGFAKFADRNSVTVTMPNNQTEGTHTFIFRNYPTVQPGSVITLRLDQEKIDDHNRKMAEPKAKVDFESVASKTLSAVTSITSLYILIANLAKTKQ